MFICHLCGSGFSDGNHCDYYMSCNEMLALLPDTISNMKQAIKYVSKEFLGNYDLESAHIYQVADEHRIDVNAWKRQQREERERKEANVEEQEAREQYEQLKKRFEVN